MDRKLEELKIIRDNKRKEFNIADQNLEDYSLLLINEELNTTYTIDQLDIFHHGKKCVCSPIDVCVSLEDSTENDCLFCGDEE